MDKDADHPIDPQNSHSPIKSLTEIQKQMAEMTEFLVEHQNMLVSRQGKAIQHQVYSTKKLTFRH
jgi:hypothetical protein